MVNLSVSTGKAGKPPRAATPFKFDAATVRPYAV